MVASNWVNLEGQTIGQKYRLIQLLEPGSQEARFSAEGIDPSDKAKFVVAVSTRKAGDAFRLESLQHPNLRHVFASETATVHGLEIRYTVLENVGESLDDVLRRGPLDEGAASELTLAVVSALDHLHGRGLVYAGLRPSSVALTDRGWVLSDFDLLRREGRVDPGETRLMLTASPHVPPDAFNGLVSPAWDVWSLGVVLNQALTDAPGRAGRRNKPTPAPPPFDSIIRGCLDPDPNERIRLRDVAGLLGTELHSSVWSKPEPPHPPKEETIPPADSLSIHEVQRNGIAQAAPARDAGHQSSGRRRSRIYSAPAAKPSLRPRVVEAEEVPSFGSRANRRGRTWAFVALGVLALGIGVLLAVLESRAKRDNNSRTGTEELHTAARQAQVAPPAPPEKVPEPPPAVDPAARKAAIIPFVIEWARTMRELNLDQHVDTYAPMVDVFFTKRAVPLSQVRAEKEKLFSGISDVRRLGVRSIRIESFQPERAVVTFRKDWDLRGPRPTAGAERERLTLRWMDGRWRITGEQEIEIYWTRKPRATKGD